MAVGRLDGQLAAGGHGVAGVDRQVEQAVLDLIGIRPGAPQAAGQDRFDLDRLPDRALKQFLHAAHQRVEVEAGGRQRLAPREGQQALGQRRRPVARLDREPDMAHQVVAAGQLVVQYVQVAQDGLQQVVEVMGDAAGKLADGLHLLGLPQGFLRLLALRHLRPDAFLQSGVQQPSSSSAAFWPLISTVAPNQPVTLPAAGRLCGSFRSWSGLARATNQR